MPPQSTYAEATPAWSMEGKTRRDAQPARDARQRLPRSFRVEAPPRPARRCASCAGWSRRPPPATAALLSPANSKERRPALPFSLSGQACQQRPPIRRLHVCTAGKALRHRFGQIAPLHWGRGLVGHGVEPAVPSRPLDEQPGFAYPPPSPQDCECGWTGKRSIQPAHFIAAVQEFHSGIMPERIMLVRIMLSGRVSLK